MSVHRYILTVVILLGFAVTIKAATNNMDINTHTLAVLVNLNDPESVEIAKYYQLARQIPESNIIYLRFVANVDSISEAEFSRVEAELRNKVPESIQAYALAWRKPWKVGCMSVTSAFSLGFSMEYCAKACKLTRPIGYFNSLSGLPYTDYAIRPSMLLSAKSVEGVKHMIDRGVTADYTRPNGTAYLLSTSDKTRNVRSAKYRSVSHLLSRLLRIELVKADAIKHVKNILFYFTGSVKVRGINDNIYLPGALADHLTSSGGQLFGGSQMSVLEWIDAGVTGTYGTVVEPCNFVHKFPDPAIVMQKYLSGSTLIEAYWKSVRMPGQGVFVGEPLAAPYKGCEVRISQHGGLEYMDTVVENYVESASRSCN